MEFNNMHERITAVVDLYKQADRLVEIFCEDYLDSFHDCGLMEAVRGGLMCLHDCLLAENHLGSCWADILELSDDEDNKARYVFIAEKYLNLFIKHVVQRRIEILLEMARNFKFIDYRAINFQNDLRGVIEEFRNFYKARCNL